MGAEWTDGNARGTARLRVCRRPSYTERSSVLVFFLRNEVAKERMETRYSTHRFETSAILRAELEKNKDAICASPPRLIITEWDVSQVSDMSGLFDGWENLNQPLRWNTAKVRSMNATFRGCSAFNQSLEWDTRDCTDFGFMFEGCDGLTGTITLDFSAVTRDIDYCLRAMFEGPRRTKGEPPLDQGRTSAYSTGIHGYQPADMRLVARNLRMPATGPRFVPPSVLGVLVDTEPDGPYSWVEFDNRGLRRALERHHDAICADPPTLVITNWDVSKVTDLRSLFASMPTFDQPLDWRVGIVEDMGGIFYMCERFNRSLQDWDVSNVRNMSSAFQGCSAFDRPLDWDTRLCSNFRHMFDGAASLASEIRLDMTSAADSASVEDIMHGTNGAKLSARNANALVEAALASLRTAYDVQGLHTPAAQKHKTCLLCGKRPARRAPPCGHVVYCNECTGATINKEQGGAKRQKVKGRCPLPECGVEFDVTYLVNRNLRDDDSNIPENEDDKCVVCYEELPVIAHKGCGVSCCAPCWSRILNGTRACPICRETVTSNDIFRTYFGNFV